MTCGIVASWRFDRGADMGMIVAVTGGPPGGDAVDQFAPIGKHDAAAVRRRDRQRRTAVFICA